MFKSKLVNIPNNKFNTHTLKEGDMSNCGTVSETKQRVHGYINETELHKLKHSAFLHNITFAKPKNNIKTPCCFCIYTVSPICILNFLVNQKFVRALLWVFCLLKMYISSCPDYIPFIWAWSHSVIYSYAIYSAKRKRIIQNEQYVLLKTDDI